MEPKFPINERFWSKVAIAGPNDCWLWKGGLTRDGYGKFYLGKDAQWVGAHRFAFELVNSPIPAGKVICHRCDNRRCCNPAHLFAGSQSENILDCYQKGRGGHRTVPEKAKEEIRSRFGAEHISKSELGRQYQVSHTTIRRILLSAPKGA